VYELVLYRMTGSLTLWYLINLEICTKTAYGVDSSCNRHCFVRYRKLIIIMSITITISWQCLWLPPLREFFFTRLTRGTAPTSCCPSDQANQLGLRVRLQAAIVYTHNRHLLLLLVVSYRKKTSGIWDALLPKHTKSMLERQDCQQ